MWIHGWSILPAQPCLFDIYSLGEEYPDFFVNGSQSLNPGLSINLALAVDLKCKKDSNSDYSPVFTIETKRINFTGEIVITPGFIV